MLFCYRFGDVIVYNRLSGPIPTEIGFLTEMATLSFSKCEWLTIYFIW